MQTAYENKNIGAFEVGASARLVVDGYLIAGMTEARVRLVCEAAYGKGTLTRTDDGWHFQPLTADENIERCAKHGRSEDR
jgi:hypothetical protein